MTYSVQPNYTNNAAPLAGSQIMGQNGTLDLQALGQPVGKLPSEMGNFQGWCGTPDVMNGGLMGGGFMGGGFIGMVQQLIGVVQQLVGMVAGMLGLGQSGGSGPIMPFGNDINMGSPGAAAGGIAGPKEEGSFFDTIKDIWGGVKDIFGFGSGDKKEGGGFWSSIVSGITGLFK